MIDLQPTKDHPMPYSMEADTPKNPIEALEVAGKTAEVLVELGSPLELNPEDAEKQAALLDQAIKSRKTNKITNVNTAFAAAAFLRTYGSSLALDISTTRSAITNKLMELANCGDPKYELKALELLGKHSDIGLFTERSEVTINYKNPAELEDAIKERVKRLLNADVIDITPLSTLLEEELGEYSPEGDKNTEENQENPEETEE